MSKIVSKNQVGEFLFYKTQDGQTRVQVRLHQETVWLTLNQMAELFDRDKSTISKHISNVFEEGELLQESTVANFATVQREASREVERSIEHFNLDVIISVGYRVKSHRGTQFRIWATERLREFIVKGFTMDDARLKEAGGGNYFDELLARIRDIRSSEKVFWRKVLDIYATSVDYDANVEVSKQFFSIVQNKMHWAAHGNTAAEIVSKRVDASKPNMGLSSWTGKTIKKTDIGIAKNYLNPEELNALNLIVSFYLDFAELQALSQKPMYMKDWIQKLDDFLRVSDRDILDHAGKVSHESAIDKAEKEYEQYKTFQQESKSWVEKDFENAIKEVKQIEGKRRKKK